ncbi:hypothetical protein [Chelatococcus sp.]|uniref:hypothetical protein n=1 Tax=Chelatococcus sp. TaxID=1953771 RepID=UPI001ED2D027|nr:hypothetical protein [Chelatococcus sp.]MBX3546895.1 hypothetical protein [Chelatococcus sp.]
MTKETKKPSTGAEVVVEKAKPEPAKPAQPLTPPRQDGVDFNDPRRRNPAEPGYVGQGLDLSVYGIAANKDQADA